MSQNIRVKMEECSRKGWRTQKRLKAATVLLQVEDLSPTTGGPNPMLLFSTFGSFTFLSFYSSNQDFSLT